MTKPIAQVYDRVLPSFVRTDVRDFFNNIGYVVVTNDLLHRTFTNAPRDLVPLVSNTVIGGVVVRCALCEGARSCHMEPGAPLPNPGQGLVRSRPSQSRRAHLLPQGRDSASAPAPV